MSRVCIAEKRSGRRVVEYEGTRVQGRTTYRATVHYHDLSGRGGGESGSTLKTYSSHCFGTNRSSTAHFHAAFSSRSIVRVELR